MSVDKAEFIGLLCQVIEQGGFIILLYQQKLIGQEVYVRWLEAQWNIIWELHAKLKEDE